MSKFTELVELLGVTEKDIEDRGNNYFIFNTGKEEMEFLVLDISEIDELNRDWLLELFNSDLTDLKRTAFPLSDKYMSENWKYNSYNFSYVYRVLENIPKDHWELFTDAMGLGHIASYDNKILRTENYCVFRTN